MRVDIIRTTILNQITLRNDPNDPRMLMTRIWKPSYNDRRGSILAREWDWVYRKDYSGLFECLFWSNSIFEIFQNILTTLGFFFFTQQ